MSYCLSSYEGTTSILQASVPPDSFSQRITPTGLDQQGSSTGLNRTGNVVMQKNTYLVYPIPASVPKKSGGDAKEKEQEKASRDMLTGVVVNGPFVRNYDYYFTVFV